MFADVRLILLHEIQEGLSSVASPDFLFPLTWPQMILSFMARFISTNSTEVGSSIFAATMIFAFFRTGSDVSEG